MLHNRILNIDILSISKSQLLDSLLEGILVTPNVDHLVKLQKDKDFYEVYTKADWVVCDSNIVNLASRFLSKPFIEVIPGSSFFADFYNYHKNNKNMKIFLLGAAEGVAAKAMTNINHKVGWNMVVGAHSPSYGFEKDIEECANIIQLINNSECNVLVVGVGAPKQEKWISEYRNDLTNVKLFMALGATIDFEAGNIKRAPLLFQKLYIEWLYRLLHEPKRLWKRYLYDDLPFFWLILKQKFNLYTSNFK